MAGYSIFNPDTGEIVQANKVYIDEPEHKKYEDQIRDLGQKFVKDKKAVVPRSTEKWYVRSGRHRSRPDMFIVVSSHVVKAGGVDAAVLRGCPIGATWALLLADVSNAPPLDSGVVDDPDMEFPFDTPGRYAVIFDRWPYKTLKINLEALA